MSSNSLAILKCFLHEYLSFAMNYSNEHMSWLFPYVNNPTIKILKLK